MRNVTKSQTLPQHACFIFSGIYRQNTLLHKFYLLLPLNNRLLLFRLRPKTKGEKERNEKACNKEMSERNAAIFSALHGLYDESGDLSWWWSTAASDGEGFNYKSQSICHQFNHISINSPAVSTEAQFNCSYQNIKHNGIEV